MDITGLGMVDYVMHPGQAVRGYKKIYHFEIPGFKQKWNLPELMYHYDLWNGK